MQEITEETPIREVDFSQLPFCAVDPDEEIAYVPPSARDYPEKLRPVFYVTCMSAKEAARLQDKNMRMSVGGGKKASQVSFSSASIAYEAVKEKLLRWENLRDRKGDLVEFHYNGIEKNMKRISSRTMLEIGQFIIEGKDLGEQAKED